jgi:hypothetical protein
MEPRLFDCKRSRKQRLPRPYRDQSGVEEDRSIEPR